MLTPDQQKLVEEAIELVPVCLNVFLKTMPCLREVAKACDLESAAYLACCKAARTYRKDAGTGVSAYFSVAIKNAMLREVQNEIKTRSSSIYRISLDAAEKRQPPQRQQEPAAMQSLLSLTAEERSWIERHVFESTSFRAFGREAGCDPRTAKRRLQSHLDKLRQAYEEEPLANS
jgi:RNA polymerase sigma factor (sigma-70 family)